jgi:hypothetical protein
LWITAAAMASQLPDALGRAWFAAELAQSAPFHLRREHARAAWVAIERIESPFERAYAAVQLLPTLAGAEHRARLDGLIDQCSDGLSRRERLHLVRALLQQVDNTESARHRDALDASIDDLLRRVAPAARALPADDELDDDHVEALAPFLDLARVRAAIAGCPASSVSRIECLAIRLAELGRKSEALGALHRLGSFEARARGFARLLDHIPVGDRAALLASVRHHLAQVVGNRHVPEVESFLVEHLTGVERDQLLNAALPRALVISHGSERRETLHRLATSAAAHLPQEALKPLWDELLGKVARQRREQFVADLVELLPAVVRLGGSDAARTIGDTLLDLSEWFP